MKTHNNLLSNFYIEQTFIKLKNQNITADDYIHAVDEYIEFVRHHEIKLGDLLHQFRQLFPGEHQSRLIPHLISRQREKKKWLEAVMSAAAHFSNDERLPELGWSHYQDTQSLKPEVRAKVLRLIAERIRSGGKVTTKTTREIRRGMQG